MTRLPTPGSDLDSWGIVLNDFLGVGHNADGSLKSSAIEDALGGDLVSAGGAGADEVPVADGGGNVVWQKIGNAQVATGAAIAYAKLALTGSIVDADIASGAAIAPSKLASYPSDATKFLRGDGTWAAPAAAGALAVIDDYTVTGSVLATYDTNTRLGGNIPQTYKDLILCVTGRGDAATQESTIQMRVNADSGTNYDYAIATVQGAALGTTANATGQTTTVIGRLTAATADAGRPSSGEWVFPNYTGTTFYKECRGVIGDSYSGASANETGTSYAVWRSNNAITRLQVFPGSGNFIIGTRFTLYGRG